MSDLFGNPRESFANVRRIDSGLPAMPDKTKRENMPKPMPGGRTIESKDGARAVCKPSRGYVEGAIIPKRGHAMGGATAPGNWTTLAMGERQDGSADYVAAERRAYAKAHVKGPQRTRRVLNADLNAEPTVEYRQPGGPGLVSR